MVWDFIGDNIIWLVVITGYKVHLMLHGALEEVVIVKRNMEENIEQVKMKWVKIICNTVLLKEQIYYLILPIFYIW